MYKVVAPGSMMLMGEHAVLHSKYCIVTAIDRKISVILKPNKSNIVNVNSSLANISTPISDIKVKKPLQFVMQSIKIFQPKIISGFDLEIISDINSTVGFGSSAAITASVVAVLLWWLEDKKPENNNVFSIAREVILSQQQSKGSCADLAASVFGGTLAYKINPISKSKINLDLKLLALYSGYKTPTVDVINIVNKKSLESPELYQDLYNHMDECTKSAISALENNNYDEFGKLMTVYQGLMVLLGVSDDTLDSIIKNIMQTPNIIGAKISGSGLGDCVVAIKNQKFDDSDIDFIESENKYNINISKEGLEYEKV